MLREPPRLPEPLQGRSAVVIRPDGDGWYAYRFVWGQWSGQDPMYVGRSRADVSRNLQGIGFSVPVWVVPE